MLYLLFSLQEEKCEISGVKPGQMFLRCFQPPVQLRFANIPGLEQHLAPCKPSLCKSGVELQLSIKIELSHSSSSRRIGGETMQFIIESQSLCNAIQPSRPSTPVVG